MVGLFLKRQCAGIDGWAGVPFDVYEAILVSSDCRDDEKLKPHPKRQQAEKPVLASLPARSLAERVVTTKASGRLALPLKPEALP